jgi:hypothetical protein
VCNGPALADLPDPAAFRLPTVGFAAMGSSGMKRKGRKHQPKVGTRPERDYALHQSERAVAANMGVTGKGWIFWTAIILIVALVVFSLVGWIFWF